MPSQRKGGTPSPRILLAFGRKDAQPTLLHAMVKHSDDEGRTWSQPEAVADHGVCPDLLLMANGVLVLSFGRPNVDLLLSPDGTGREWLGPISLYRGMGCSYTSLREAENGELMAFFSQSGFCGTPGPGPLNMIRLARLSVQP